MGGVQKRMGRGKRTRERALPKNSGPLQKSFWYDTPFWERGVIRKVFLPPLFSTPIWDGVLWEVSLLSLETGPSEKTPSPTEPSSFPKCACNKRVLKEHINQGGSGTEPEPGTGIVGTVFPETESGTGTAGTVFQEPKPEPEPSFPVKLY